MAVTVRFDEQNSIILVVFRDIVTPAEALDLASTLNKYDQNLGWIDRLHFIAKGTDLSQISSKVLGMAKDRILEFRHTSIKDKRFVTSKSAFVVESETNIGITKLYRALWEIIPDEGPTFEVFETTEEALKWLGRDRIELAILDDMIRQPVLKN